MRSAKDAFEHLKGLAAIVNYELCASARKAAAAASGRRP